MAYSPDNDTVIFVIGFDVSRFTNDGLLRHADFPSILLARRSLQREP